jgi:hypothetical protein
MISRVKTRKNNNIGHFWRTAIIKCEFAFRLLIVNYLFDDCIHRSVCSLFVYCWSKHPYIFIPNIRSVILRTSVYFLMIVLNRAARPQARLNLKFLAWPDPPMYIPSLLSGQARPTLVAWLQYDIHFSSSHFETCVVLVICLNIFRLCEELLIS